MHESERRIAAVAAQQDSVLSLEQLRAAGVRRGALAHRLRTGSASRLHPCVYLLGYGPPTLRQRMRAALLYAGEQAVVSHRSAAVLWGLLPADGRAETVEVTVRAGRVRSRLGVVVHRSRTMLARDIRVREGIPVTSPTRTVFDLAAREAREIVEAAFTEAIVHRLTSAAEIRRAAALQPGSKGAARILRLLEDEENGYTRSEAERRLRALLRDSGLPMPRFNVLTEGHLVDCRWEQQRLILFVDGFATHGARPAFEADRRCDQALVAAEWRVIRVTWRQLTHEPLAVLARIAQALTRAWADRARTVRAPQRPRPLLSDCGSTNRNNPASRGGPPGRCAADLIPAGSGAAAMLWPHRCATGTQSSPCWSPRACRWC
jgi:very-short-patch-repair endonuclease